MSRNSSGTYSLPAGNPVVTNTVISSTWANSTLTDIATALTQSIASTGVTTPSANLPMGTFRHTGVGNATAKTCYPSVGDIQGGTLITLGAVSGTDTITATAPFTLTAYAANQGFRFFADGTNTGATTINIDGLGAKNILKNGSAALSASNLLAGGAYEIVYDGTQFQLQNPSSASGLLVNSNTFTRDLTAASGTQAVTGVGFLPKAVFLIGAVSGGVPPASVGIDTGNGNPSVIYNNHADTANAWGVNASNSIFIVAGASSRQNGVVTSLDADGFTITWTKVGSPTGTATIGYLALG